MAEEPASAPTIDDLRVRLCYICRDEEAHGDPAPRRWVHPCSCTLIAHESCLLHWIRTAQSSTTQSPASALKCPQCGAAYVLESQNPPLLRILDAANRALSRAGRIVTVTGIGALTIACVGGVYVLLSSYGAFALREFYGPAYYDLHLGDDAGAWQWQVWLALPLIPLSLVSARIPGLPLPSLPTALLLPWPSLFPTPTLTAAGTSYALTPAARSSPISSTILRRTSLWPLHSAPLWPPSPTLLCAVMPIISGLYGRAVKKLEKVAVNVEGGQSGVGVGMPEPVRRFVWALGGGDAAAEVRIDIARAEAPAANQVGGEAAAGGQDQAGAGVGAGGAQPEPQPGLGEEEGEAAARIVRVTGASLGRILGGALALPTIARLAGALLLRLSRHSPILSRILAARPDASAVATVYEWDFGTTNSGGVIGAIQRAAKKEGLKFGAGGALMVFGRMIAFGHRAWMDGDPVWWRNALGLGLFVVAKDALRLLHLRLAALELASRRLKDRDFAGIDPAELDLVRPWPAQGRGIGVARPQTV